jgi:hypothetical protein
LGGPRGVVRRLDGDPHERGRAREHTHGRSCAPRSGLGGGARGRGTRWGRVWWFTTGTTTTLSSSFSASVCVLSVHALSGASFGMGHQGTRSGARDEAGVGVCPDAFWRRRRRRLLRRLGVWGGGHGGILWGAWGEGSRWGWGLLGGWPCFPSCWGFPPLFSLLCTYLLFSLLSTTFPCGCA